MLYKGINLLSSTSFFKGRLNKWGLANREGAEITKSTKIILVNPKCERVIGATLLSF